MSDSDESGVTYIDISSPFEELSDIGSLRADDHEHLELPKMLEDPYVEVSLQAPPSSDYIPSPEEPEQAPPSPDYVPGPKHADDEIVDDDMDIEADEEEEEHPAPADSVVVASTAADQTPYAEETKPFETDESAATPLPHPAYRMIARISIPAPVPIPAWSDLEIVRLLAMSSPPASSLSPWSSPPPRIPFPPLPPILSPPSPVLSPVPPPSPIPSTSSPPLQPPSASCREDRPEVTLPPRKKLAGDLRADYGFVATMDREIMRDPEREVGYGITDSWDEIVEALELGGYIREFETRVRQDMDEIYMRRAHAYTRHLMEIEARMSREACVRLTDASDLVRGEVMSLRTTVLGQMTEIRELHVADRRRQIVISELLRADHRRSIKIIELRTALHGQVTAFPIRSLGYRAAMIRLRAEAVSTSHSPPLPSPFILSPTRSDAPSSGTPLLLPISASTSLPPLLLPSASRREDRPEVTLPPQKRLAGGLRADYGFVATMDREIMRDPEREVGYGITDSWDEIVETLQGAPVSTDTKLGGYMREFETRVRQDTEEIYMRQRLDCPERLGYESDLVRGEVMSLRTTVLGQMTKIRELHAADRRRQTVISEMLRADHRRSTEIIELRTALQGQVIALQVQVTVLQGQQGLVGGPTQPELPEEAGSGS
nr:hypothetical protein [Tanacetum cinerariifolium]